MSVSNVSATQTGQTTWYFAWESDQTDPTYYIYVDGVLAATTLNTFYTVSAAPGSVVRVEIFDNDTDSPSAAYPGNAYLSWDAVDNATQYIVQQKISGSWITLATVRDTGLSELAYKTRTLDDGTTHEFRITPYNDGGIAGLVRLVNVYMVRTPSVLTTGYSYDDETTKITISEA